MCIIIYKPKGRYLKKRTLKQAWAQNRDGAGFMYAEDGRVRVRKPYYSFETFWEAYKKHVLNGAGKRSDVVVHLRVMTRGKMDELNTHPHRISDGLAFCHNGTIAGVGTDRDRSDTVLFMDKVLRHMRDDWLEHPGVVAMVEQFVGASKLAFMDDAGNVDILNQDRGEWRDGLWYSNPTWRGGARSAEALVSPRRTWTGAATTAVYRRDRNLSLFTDSALSRLTNLRDGEDFQHVDDDGHSIVVTYCESCGTELEAEAEIRFRTCVGCAAASLDIDPHEFKTAFLGR